MKRILMSLVVSAALVPAAALACDGTGNVLVSGSYDTTLCIWNLVNKQIPATASRTPAGNAR